MANIEEKFEISSLSTGITEADGDGTNWKDVWDFQVPLNTKIVLKPTDFFSCYLDGDDAAEMPAVTEVRLLHRDVANEQTKPLIRALLYQQVKPFQDTDKLIRLDIVKAIVIQPSEHIVVQIKGADATGTGDVDASDSYFKLVTARLRRSLD